MEWRDMICVKTFNKGYDMSKQYLLSVARHEMQRRILTGVNAYM